MPNILEVKNVTKTYAKFKLDNFSFSIPEGKIVGFIGRNGAGKTTTLKGIMDLIHFDSGEVFYRGTPFKDCMLDAKQEIGFTLSELNYYPQKTVEQVMKVTNRFYKSFDKEKFKHLCERFSLDLKKKLQDLSSGMKVKFSLAVALSHDAKLLILDEPTSGLDPISRDELLDIFNSIVKDKSRSILFSTHITSDLDKCADDILYIRGGKKIFEGSKEQFLDSYISVSSSIKDFPLQLRESALSYKESKNKINALFSIEQASKLKKYKTLTIAEPDLEEIMILLERNDEHEEFIL